MKWKSTLWCYSVERPRRLAYMPGRAAETEAAESGEQASCREGMAGTHMICLSLLPAACNQLFVVNPTSVEQNTCAQPCHVHINASH